MAELKFTALADLKAMQKQLNDFFKQTFSVKTKNEGGGTSGGAAAGTSGGGKGGKGVLRLLGGILAAVAPITIVASAIIKILDIFKIIELFFNGLILAVFQIWEVLKAIGNYWKTNFIKIKDWFAEVGANIVNWIAELPSKIWEFMVDIWNALKEQFPILQKVQDFISGVWTTLKEIFSAFFNDPVGTLKKGLQFVWDIIRTLPERIWNFMAEMWNTLKEQFPILESIANFVSGLFDKIKTAVSNFFDDPVGTLKSALQFVWDVISELPAKIWEFMKKLPDLIATALKSILDFGKRIGSSVKNFFTGGGSQTVNDAIITRDGKVIQTNPRDTIFATKNPGGMGGQVVNNFYGVTPKEIVDYLERNQGMRLRNTGRF